MPGRAGIWRARALMPYLKGVLSPRGSIFPTMSDEALAKPDEALAKIMAKTEGYIATVGLFSHMISKYFL